MIALQNDGPERPQATSKVVGWNIKRKDQKKTWESIKKMQSHFNWIRHPIHVHERQASSINATDGQLCSSIK
jgi:hypothetical protein